MLTRGPGCFLLPAGACATVRLTPRKMSQFCPAMFMLEEDRNKLIALAREGSVASRVTRRANALVLLDDGWSCQEVADAFLLNDDTIRGWFKLFEQRGIESLTSFDVAGARAF